MVCLDENLILRFVMKRASESERTRVEEHLDVCDACRTAVSEVTRVVRPPLGEAATEDTQARNHGTAERYEIEGVMGVGGGGIVYRATDRELHRSIALKVIRTGGTLGSAPDARERLLREARAMARLSHPNVVAIHDVGTFEDQVFLVMDLVEGQTLAEWLAGRPHSVSEILEVFLQAGQGLAAAHRAGLVHRDFKPQNVLVSHDGRVCVTDFGLAVPPREVTAPPELTDGSTTGNANTQMAGTPGYMAPEQIREGKSDSRSDQFGFCVALFMALHDRHPFADPTDRGSAATQLAARVREGVLAPPPRKPAVPAALHEALVRGLAMKPDDRHASMDDLLKILKTWRDDRQRRPTPVMSRLAWAALVIVAVGGLWTVLRASRVPSTPAASVAICGNGQVESPEVCDDGNTSDADGCLTTCRFANCGDGHVRAFVEECDDRNVVSGDGCDASCLRCMGKDARFTWTANGHCYTRHNEARTWADARATCTAAGGDLVSYSTTQEGTSVFENVQRGFDRDVWIGVQVDGQGALGMVSREPPHAASSTSVAMWGPDSATNSGEPPGTCGLQRASVRTNIVPLNADQTPYPYPYEWRGFPCEEEHPFLCERAGKIIRKLDNHAYEIVVRPTTWLEATARCTEGGGHLATLGDVEENNFIAAQTFVDLWIGASDPKGSGQFTWLGGTAVPPEGFATGEPDGVGPPGQPNALSKLPHHCVVIGADKRWHDRTCSQQYGYVCEIDHQRL